MTLKIVVLALALLAGWVMLFRPKPFGRGGPSGGSTTGGSTTGGSTGRRRTAPRLRKPAPRVTAFERCPRCGAYRLPDGPCACPEPPETAER